jgi:hypothetical protein
MPATQSAETPTTNGPTNMTDASKLRLDTSDLKSSYCNVCNVNSTKEEVILSLGINQGWELESRNEIDVKLQHRIILSPFAAKRLAQMLNGLIGEYEGRYGELR